MTTSPTTLDPAQITRIEAVHRGFLYQHLYAASCLLKASSAQAAAVIVEADEDIEIALNERRLYVQVKTRQRPLIYSDIKESLQRFEEIGEQHRRGRRPGACSFTMIANVAPGPELNERISARDWPQDVTVCWPGQRHDAALPEVSPDVSTAFAACTKLAAALPLGTLTPETLVWKLAAAVMAAAAGIPPRQDHAFDVEGLPALFEQLVIELQDFPAPPPVYRPQSHEPDLVTEAPLRVITGFSGAGKTAWAAQAAQHSEAELSYFDVGDLPGLAVAIPLARELAARHFGSGGGLGQILLPGSTGLEMLHALALRLQSQGIKPAVVVDNAHRVPSENLREIIRQATGVRFIFLCQPGAVVHELEATLGLTLETLQGWDSDTIAAEAADAGCTTTPASAQRLFGLTAGLPLYVQSAVRIVAAEYKGNLEQFCDDLEKQIHGVATAQEIILSKVFNNLTPASRDAIAVLSMLDIPLVRDEALALLHKCLGTEEGTFARLVRELRQLGIIEVFGGNRVKIHDAIRVLGRAHLAEFAKERREAAHSALRDVLLASILKERNLPKFSLYIRTLAEIGDIKPLVEFATDELFHELGVIQEIEPILEQAAASSKTNPAQRFSALDGLVFADLKYHRVEAAAKRLELMAQIVEEHRLDDTDRLTLAMKEMNFAALKGDEEAVRSKIETILERIPDSSKHKRVFEYNAAHAFMNLGHYRDCVAVTSRLIAEYFDVLGLEMKDILQKNPHEIFPLLKKGVDHLDDLKHLADTLDLHATALDKSGRDSGLARIHAIKFYSMANALDSVIRVGQDLADEFVARNDYIGARDVMERNILPNVVEHKMVRHIVPVRAQYAVILAYCGEHAAADAEMRRLAPYEAGLEEGVRADLQNQKMLISRLRSAPPSPQWQMPPPRRKIGRNEPCYCGSGKKFKRCHGKAH